MSDDAFPRPVSVEPVAESSGALTPAQIEAAMAIPDRFHLAEGVPAAMHAALYGTGEGTPVSLLCLAPATLIVFRGRTARLYLCAAHRHRYTGRGHVGIYVAEAHATAELRDRIARGESLFVGPARVCGETT